MRIRKQCGQFLFEVAESVGGIILTRVIFNDRAQLDLKIHYFMLSKDIHASSTCHGFLMGILCSTA